MRHEFFRYSANVFYAARLFEHEAPLRREQRKILDRKNDRLLGAVIDMLVVSPRRAKKRVAFRPFDFLRFLVLVLHHVKSGALDDVVDRKRVVTMCFQTLAGVENSHANERTRRRAMRFFGIIVNEYDETTIRPRDGVAGDFLELRQTVLPVPTGRANVAANGLWVPLVVAHERGAIKLLVEFADLNALTF